MSTAFIYSFSHIGLESNLPPLPCVAAVKSERSLARHGLAEAKEEDISARMRNREPRIRLVNHSAVAMLTKSVLRSRDSLGNDFNRARARYLVSQYRARDRLSGTLKKRNETLTVRLDARLTLTGTRLDSADSMHYTIDVNLARDVGFHGQLVRSRCARKCHAGATLQTPVAPRAVKQKANGGCYTVKGIYQNRWRHFPASDPQQCNQ
nr:hypothetical protein CFP56_53574 [Quercus suber]